MFAVGHSRRHWNSQQQKNNSPNVFRWHLTFPLWAINLIYCLGWRERIQGDSRNENGTTSDEINQHLLLFFKTAKKKTEKGLDLKELVSGGAIQN